MLNQPILKSLKWPVPILYVVTVTWCMCYTIALNAIARAIPWVIQSSDCHIPWSASPSLSPLTYIFLCQVFSTGGFGDGVWQKSVEPQYVSICMYLIMSISWLEKGLLSIIWQLSAIWWLFVSIKQCWISPFSRIWFVPCLFYVPWEWFGCDSVTLY